MSVPPAPDRRDRLPPWVIVLLLIFLGLRLLDLGVFSRFHLHTHRVPLHASSQVDDKTMEALLTSNYEAKSAFIVGLGTSGATVKPDRKALQAALRAAQSLQKFSGNAPSAARRIFVLRALLHLPPPAAGQAAEAQIWASALAGKPLPPRQVAQEAAQIRSLPNLRWWAYPSLMALYAAQNDPVQAQRYARQARNRALLTMLPLTLMLLFWGGLGLLGVLLLAALAARAFQQHYPSPEAAPLPEFWQTVPEPQPLAERKLRAGDLMGIFVLYLLMPNLLGFLLTGVDLPGHSVPGLLTSSRPYLESLPDARYEAFTVALEFCAYLISALIPIGLLALLARRRGASLSDELGWNVRRFGTNLLYGFGGYGVGLPLMLLVGYAGSKIHAPTPSNPAIPLLANASSFWVQLLLVALATIAAPLTEEFLFRGVFFNAAKLRVGVWPAIVLTGLIFGFVHPVGISQMLPLAVLGGVFAWMAQTRKSLVPSMLGHCLQNLMATLYLLLVLAG